MVKNMIFIFLTICKLWYSYSWQSWQYTIYNEFSFVDWLIVLLKKLILQLGTCKQWKLSKNGSLQGCPLDRIVSPNANV